MNNIASVVIGNCTRTFDKEYHYLIPDNLTSAVKPGVRVFVPFGKSNRQSEGYVLGVSQNTDIDGLKSVAKVIDSIPVLNESMMRLAAWMKDRYICTHSDAIKCMLPPGIGAKSTRIVKLLKREEGSNKSEKKILDTIFEYGGECEYEQLKSIANIRGFSKHITLMEASGLVSVCEEYNVRVKEKTVRAAYIAMSREEIIDEIESSRIRRIQQVRILEMLLDNEYISTTDIVRFSGVSAGVLNTLKKYGYIDFKDIEVKRNPFASRTIERTSPLVPTQQQAGVLDKVKAHIDSEQFNEILLHGVTGSGKTEVYLQLIQYVIEKGRQAIVLVPEISLTPQMVERFKGRFGESVAVLHSRLSLGERFDQWRLIRDGRIKVAIGARSGVFAPFDKLGIIIIDEEHENTYKSEVTPKYHAKDIAKERCMFENAVLIYGSATPSIETYNHAENGNMEFLEMKDRANNMVMPAVEIVDMRSELDKGNRTVFSTKLTGEIEKNISASQQTILFLNRRGYASFVFCRKCGYTVKCVNCNTSLTYHANDERLICHYCGYTIKNPEVCPSCKSNYIRHFGTGTQKIEEEIRKQYPESSVIRMDMDTTTYKNSHEEILRAFREQNINIMVGTQMIAKGHDFPNVTLVGVLAADSLLNTGDYRASERTFQLITQVAGRAGRGELPGRVVIQTYNTEDFSILCACRHDYASFYSQEIKIREKLGFPPFTNIAVAILSGPMDSLALDRAKAVKAIMQRLCENFQDSVEILGPARAPLSRIKNKYRWRIVIKCKDMDRLLDIMSRASDEFYKGRKKNMIELSIDINPVNML